RTHTPPGYEVLPGPGPLKFVPLQYSCSTILKLDNQLPGPSAAEHAAIKPDEGFVGDKGVKCLGSNEERDSTPEDSEWRQLIGGSPLDREFAILCASVPDGSNDAAHAGEGLGTGDADVPPDALIDAISQPRHRYRFATAFYSDHCNRALFNDNEAIMETAFKRYILLGMRQENAGIGSVLNLYQALHFYYYTARPSRHPPRRIQSSLLGKVAFFGMIIYHGLAMGTYDCPLDTIASLRAALLRKCERLLHRIKWRHNPHPSVLDALILMLAAWVEDDDRSSWPHWQIRTRFEEAFACWNRLYSDERHFDDDEIEFNAAKWNVLVLFALHLGPSFKYNIFYKLKFRECATYSRMLGAAIDFGYPTLELYKDLGSGLRCTTTNGAFWEFLTGLDSAFKQLPEYILDSSPELLDAIYELKTNEELGLCEMAQGYVDLKEMDSADVNRHMELLAMLMPCWTKLLRLDDPPELLRNS
ncbi:hypothetical protein SISNIDRAFT_458027, partial [Sistotremastrum niveocremeum HHB9708]